MGFWKENVYQGVEDERPGELISLTDIVGPVVRTSVTVNGTLYWLTTTLKQVRRFSTCVRF